MTKKTRVLAAGFAALAISLLAVSAALGVAPVQSVTLDKVADPASLPSGGGDVTYWYTLTNTGDGDFHGAAVTDDTCSPVEFDSSSDGTSPGANGNDGFLKTGEWWKFSCTASLTATTTNTAWGFGCKDSSTDQCNQGTHEAAASDSATVTVGTTTATIDTTGTSAAVLALVLLAIGGLGFLGTTNRLPKLPKFR